MKSLKSSIIFLLIFLIVFLVLSYIFKNNSFLSSLLQNVAISACLATIVSIKMINQVLIKNDEEKKIKYNKVALFTIKTPLKRVLDNLVSFYIYGTEKKEKNDNLESFFDEEYYSVVKNLKFYFKTNHINLSTNEYMSIIECFSFYVNNLNINLENMIFKYNIYLESDLLDTIEKIINSELYSYFRNFKDFEKFEIARIEQIGNKDSVLSYGEASKSFREYIELIIKLIQKFNSLNSENRIIISNNIWQMPGAAFIPGQAKISK